MPARRCRLALLGFGTVGSAVARRLVGPDLFPGLALTHILDRRAALKQAQHPDLAHVAWTTSIDDVLRSDVDVVVETIGGVDPAASWIGAALAAGKSVVTANKQVVAREGARLLRIAERQGRQLRFEAAVGGAMPIVRAVGEGLAGDRITRIVAILNGTTNAVLSQMEATGCALDAALAAARARGLAEADPSADLDGDDACAKLAILCALAFGVRVEPAQIPVRTCSAIAPADLAAARRDRCTIRQIARAEFDYARARLTASVAPERVAQTSIFARTIGPENAALITGAHSGETGIFGVGAGGDATSVAILSDIVAIARDRAAIVPAPHLISAFRVERSELEVAC
ncbi:MAG TPA: homoserine dehydrogenase [Vicinamibacterales bacterium]|nr:homoserine dehydrogenase [Vicinamibacterales bacterium]